MWHPPEGEQLEKETEMLFFDIETEANPYGIQFMPEPEAPANYKDEFKIAAYVKDKLNEQIERAALDADYGRIVAIGWKVKSDPIMSMIHTETSEADMLGEFWQMLYEQKGHCCGYNILGFDLPYMLRRSMELNVPVPYKPVMAKYRLLPTLDLMGVLYNWQNFKGLKFVAQRYGLDNPLPDLDGSQVATMEPETLRAYVENDVYLVYQLWQKMSGIYF